MDISGEKRAMQNKIIYALALVGVTALYVTYVPHLLDYYVVRPQYSFFEFYQGNIFDQTYVFEGAVLGLVLAGLYCITVNAGVSTLILSAALFALTHAGYLKYVNRRELLRLDDLRLTEAAGMAADYIRFEYSPFLLLLAGVLLAFSGAGFGAELLRKWSRSQTATTAGEEGKSRFQWAKLAARALGVLAVFGILTGYTHHYFGSRMQWHEVDAFNPVETGSNRYVLYQFLRNDRLAVINAEDVIESRTFLTERGAMLAQASGSVVDTGSDSDVYPNVIVIMNESWWNTDWLDADKITFSKDPMEPYKKLESQCGSGYLTANVYGGGTVSSEAEFLTGLNTKYYVSGSGIYSSTLDRRLPSVVDYFEELDYETTAIHPYYGDFYSRRQVYNNMAFDNIIFEEDMQYREPYTRYISDDSLVREIIARYESSDSERQFIWSVSVANHGLNLEYPGEYAEDYEYPISVSMQQELGKEDQRRLTNYVNGIYLANQAYTRLVEYFSEKEEPVVLVMYGDHIPNFSEEIFDALGFDTSDSDVVKVRDAIDQFGEDSAGGGETNRLDILEPLSTTALSMEQRRTVYSVPVLLWSNAAAEKSSCRGTRPSFTGESIFYLPQMVLDYAGLPDSDMSLALRYERSLFKTNSRTFVLDAEGESVWQCTEEQVQGLRTMQVVEYDILYGEGLCRDIWLPLKKEE